MRTKSVDAILEAQAKAPKLNLNSLFSNFLPWSPLVEEVGVCCAYVCVCVYVCMGVALCVSLCMHFCCVQ
ncbi:hypothetical protein EON63_24155 [archaeon]|nr:MAG: hypothetical protein EON63_24155 [archaeon]